VKRICFDGPIEEFGEDVVANKLPRPRLLETFADAVVLLVRRSIDPRLTRDLGRDREELFLVLLGPCGDAFEQGRHRLVHGAISPELARPRTLTARSA
jgi:hypothetical protein